VTARTLNELFEESARALMAVMYGSCRTGRSLEVINLEAADPAALLRDFLSEVLFLTEAKNIVFCDVVVFIEGNRLTASLAGALFNKDVHAGGTEVKGISYEGLSIVRDSEGYSVELLFDV
jgi:SHS2 domain-containing protein